MSVITWPSAILALTRIFGPRKAIISADLDRLSARDLADLNLPFDIKARIDIHRELYRRDRIGF